MYLNESSNFALGVSFLEQKIILFTFHVISKNP